MIAIRENETRAYAVGYDARRFKMLAFALSGAVTSLAGGLYAMQLHFVPLENIQMAMSEHIVIMTVIGGTGSLFGSLLGAGSWVILADLLSSIWPRWMILMGGGLIAVVLFLRGGLWSGLEALMQRLCTKKRAPAQTDAITPDDTAAPGKGEQE